MTTTDSTRGTITISHTRAEGTLIEGSRQGDGVWEILKGLRTSWRPMHSLGCLGLGQSRDKPAKRWRIEQAAAALREQGWAVAVEIDDTTAGRDVAARTTTASTPGRPPPRRAPPTAPSTGYWT